MSNPNFKVLYHYGVLARGIVNDTSVIDFTDFPIEFANGLTLGYRNQSPGTGTLLIYYL